MRGTGLRMLRAEPVKQGNQMRSVAGTVAPCAEAGVLGALAGVMGSLMALEVIRAITGFGEPLVGRLLLVDGLTMRFETMRYGWDETNSLNGIGAG